MTDFTRPTSSARRRLSSYAAHGLEPLEQRRVLAVLQQVFTDDDGDTCLVVLNATNPALSVVDNTGLGTIFIQASATGSGGVLTISLDPSDNGGTGDNRIDLRSLVTTGIRTVTAPTTDIHLTAGFTGNNLDVTVGDVDGASLFMASQNASGRRMRLTARDVSGTSLSLSGIVERAQFRTITNLATIIAPSIVTLQINNAGQANARFNLSVSGVGAEWAVKTIHVAGAVEDGTWTMVGNVQSIQVGTVFNASTQGGPGAFAINVSGRLGTLKATAPSGDLDGTFDARSFGAISAVDRIVARIRGGASNITFQSLDSLRADTLQSSILLGGAIGQVHLGSSISALFDVDTIRTMNVVGGAGPAVYSLTSIILHGTTGPNALGTFNLAGVMDSSTIRTYANNIGSITIGGMAGVSRIIVGNNASLNTFPSDLNGFGDFSIGSLRINARTGDPLNLSGFFVAARTINNLYSRARINLSGDAGPYGVIAETIGTLSFRRVNNSIFTNTGGAGFTDGDFSLVIL